jgi:hypothetical protein
VEPAAAPFIDDAGADGEPRMKASITAALLMSAVAFALAAPAQAKLTPANAQMELQDFFADDPLLTGETSGTLREQAYFSAPQTPQPVSKGLPCRMQLPLDDTTPLARSC